MFENQLCFFKFTEVVHMYHYVIIIIIFLPYTLLKVNSSRTILFKSSEPFVVSLMLLNLIEYWNSLTMKVKGGSECQKLLRRNEN